MNDTAVVQAGKIARHLEILRSQCIAVGLNTIAQNIYNCVEEVNQLSTLLQTTKN